MEYNYELPDVPDAGRYRRMSRRSAWDISQDPDFPCYIRMWFLTIAVSDSESVATFKRGQMSRLLLGRDGDPANPHTLRDALRKLKERGLIAQDSTSTRMKLHGGRIIQTRKDQP